MALGRIPARSQCGHSLGRSSPPGLNLGMSKPIVLFHRLAQGEFDKAYDWYSRRSIDAARRFQAEDDVVIGKIADDPKRWPIYRDPYRWLRTRRFPYVLYFRRVDADRTLVMAVAHGRRRPGY